VSEETAKNRLTEITELLHLKHLSSQEETNIMKLVTDTGQIFPGEKLTATNILQH